MIEEFLLYPSFSEKGKFLCLARVYCFLGSFGERNNRTFGGLSKLLLMFGLLPGSIYPYGLQYEAFM